MCRLYGFRASGRTKVECSLIYAQNALLAQSRKDSRGGRHTDGWGLGFFAGAEPVVERRATAAFEDLAFSTAVERVYADTVVAHVRAATVGGAALANTHPFTYRRWIFAHNGTVRPFTRLAAAMRDETLPHLAANVAGTTDSETAFFWLLSRLANAGIDIESGAADAVRVGTLVGEAVTELERRSAAGERDRPAMLNFLLTNGELLVASRWQRGLHVLVRKGVHDCEICGIPHVEEGGEEDYRAVVVASEPITHEAWGEVPEGSVVVVDGDLTVEIRPVAA